MEIVFIVLILILVIAFFILSNRNCKVKNTALKKEEIILEYENKLQKLLKQYPEDRTKQIEEKKKFLQKCNNELSRNIFFTHEESKKVIQRLLKI